jgi:hypothetical protein
MSRAARDRAHDYTWERYGERLLAALKAKVRRQTVEAGNQETGIKKQQSGAPYR